MTRPAAHRALDTIVLVIVLIACLPPLVIDIAGRDPTRTMETVTLVTSWETWRRSHNDEPNAWLIPTNNGQRRLRKPPLVVWTNMAAWSGLDPVFAPMRTVIGRARLASVSAGLLVIAAVYCIGLMMGGRTVATLSGLMAGSAHFLQHQARSASYDIHLTAWTTAAVALGLWALCAQDRRALVGWVGAGVALAAGWMSKGPLAVLLVALPLGAAVLMTPGRRRGAAGLAVALLVGAALAAPWYVSVWREVPNLWAYMQSEATDMIERRSNPLYYGLLLVMVAPWSAWLIAGLVHPWREHGPARRAGLIIWTWLVSLVVLLSLAGSREARYALPAIPAAAVLIAQAWAGHRAMAARGAVDAGAVLLRRIHWGSLLAAGLAAGPFLALQPWIVARGWLESAPTGTLGAGPAAALTVTLLAIAIIGWRWHARGHVDRAAVATAAWALVMTTTFWHTYAAAPSAVSPIRAEARRLDDEIGQAPLHYLFLSLAEGYPEERLRLFLSGRIIPRVAPEDLEQRGDGAPDLTYVLARPVARHDAIMQAAGYVASIEVHDGDRSRYRLWVRR